MIGNSLCIPQATGNPPMDRFWSNAIAHYKSPNMPSSGLPQAKRPRTGSMPALEPMFLPSMSSSILSPSIPSILSRMPHGISSTTTSLSENFQASKKHQASLFVFVGIYFTVLRSINRFFYKLCHRFRFRVRVTGNNNTVIIRLGPHFTI